MPLRPPSFQPLPDPCSPAAVKESDPCARHRRLRCHGRSEQGLESRPLGGLVDFIKNTTNPMHHVTEGCQLQPINVENGNNGNATRTEKHLGWSTEEDLRLVSAWLNNSNNPIESNFKKNDKYWADVAAAYNSTTPSSRFRQVKQVKDRFSKIKKKVGNFCCSWKEANSLCASGECNVDLMAKAQKIYENDFKDGPFLLT
ncbi:hypothetical protein OsI_19566 [Oryza sativa Indica Group]|uniref:Myb-like domain-containing protein n=1 Tax=Oryza sativa subsp. indica TaxID=39946 RepID=B8AX13_ORYSI|nr:hypothetical protein OsI_19566 [Oryza sativa Indica Group]